MADLYELILSGRVRRRDAPCTTASSVCGSTRKERQRWLAARHGRSARRPDELAPPATAPVPSAAARRTMPRRRSRDGRTGSPAHRLPADDTSLTVRRRVQRAISESGPVAISSGTEQVGKLVSAAPGPLANGRTVEAQVDAVHRERGAHPPAELRLEPADGAGHDAERSLEGRGGVRRARGRHRAGRPPARRRSGWRGRRSRASRHGWHGSPTTRSTSAATSWTDTKFIGFSPRPNTTGRPDRFAVSHRTVDPQLEEGGRTHDRRRGAAHERVLLGCVLHTEQLHRAVGGGGDDRYEHDVRPGGGGGIDQVGVAVAIDGGGRDVAGPDEAVHG